MVEVELNEKLIYRVIGPASLNVLKGKLRVQAANWEAGSRIVVSKTTSLPIYSPEGVCRLEIMIGEGGEFIPEDSGNPVVEWEKKLKDLIMKLIEHTKLRKCKVLVLGEVDSGKTTATTMLANICLELGFKVAIIDGDVGQSDIGPPTFISMSILNKPIITPKELEPIRMYFIGDITPYLYHERIARGIRELIDEAYRMNVDVVVVDTDGWFKGIKALRSKLEVISAVRPEAVVVIGRKNENVDYMLKLKSFNINLCQLTPPTTRRTRSRDERKILREQAYSKYFSNAKTRVIKLNEILVIPELIITGKCVSPQEVKVIEDSVGCKIRYCELWFDEMIIVLEGSYKGRINVRDVIEKLKELYGNKTYHVLFEGWEKGLIAAVLDENFNHIAPAIIEHIDYENLKIRLYTPWDEEVKGLAVGRVRLQRLEEGSIKEVGRF